jgi:hypothetical protein
MAASILLRRVATTTRVGAHVRPLATESPAEPPTPKTPMAMSFEEFIATKKRVNVRGSVPRFYFFIFFCPPNLRRPKAMSPAFQLPLSGSSAHRWWQPSRCPSSCRLSPKTSCPSCVRADEWTCCSLSYSPLLTHRACVRFGGRRRGMDPLVFAGLASSGCMVLSFGAGVAMFKGLWRVLNRGVAAQMSLVWLPSGSFSQL